VKLKYVLLHQKKGTHNYLQLYESTKKKSIANLHFASFENLPHSVSWQISNGELEINLLFQENVQTKLVLFKDHILNEYLPTLLNKILIYPQERNPMPPFSMSNSIM
jgi:hypothetical protein